MIARIAGASHCAGAADTLRRLPDGTPLSLRAEPENPHDAMAIVVEVEGMKVGYVGAAYAPPGISRNRDFHRFTDAWETARLVRNDAGEWRVKIDTA